MKEFTLKSFGMAAVLPLLALSSPVIAGAPQVISAASAAPTHDVAPITKAEVEAAQLAWGNALVAISTEYDSKGFAAAKRLAETVIDSAYGYNLGPVLFKPTLTFKVSLETCTSKCVLFKPVAVKQTPFTAMLSPSCTSSNPKFLALIDNFTSSPTCVIVSMWPTA